MPGDYAGIHLQIGGRANVSSACRERADFRRQGALHRHSGADKPLEC